LEDGMIGVIATLKVQDGKNAEFEGVFRELQQQVKANEPGNLAYQLTRSRTDPNTYKVLELYKDQEALTHHGGTDYFKAAGPKLGPCLAGRPEIEYLDAVE
jgi:quinol monooxygenase YgiN